MFNLFDELNTLTRMKLWLPQDLRKACRTPTLQSETQSAHRIMADCGPIGEGRSKTSSSPGLGVGRVILQDHKLSEPERALDIGWRGRSQSAPLSSAEFVILPPPSLQLASTLRSLSLGASAMFIFMQVEALGGRIPCIFTEYLAALTAVSDAFERRFVAPGSSRFLFRLLGRFCVRGAFERCCPGR